MRRSRRCVVHKGRFRSFIQLRHFGRPKSSEAYDHSCRNRREESREKPHCPEGNLDLNQIRPLSVTLSRPSRKASTPQPHTWTQSTRAVHFGKCTEVAVLGKKTFFSEDFVRFLLRLRAPPYRRQPGHNRSERCQGRSPVSPLGERVEQPLAARSLRRCERDGLWAQFGRERIREKFPGTVPLTGHRTGA